MLTDKLEQFFRRDKTQTHSPTSLDMVQRANISPVELVVTISPSMFASALDIVEDRIRTEPLTFSLPFQIRKKGVESKFNT